MARNLIYVYKVIPYPVLPAKNQPAVPKLFNTFYGVFEPAVKNPLALPSRQSYVVCVDGWKRNW